MVINPKDGAMYFAIEAGNQVRSLSVTYEGRESTVPAPLMTGSEDQRAIRRHLESFHGRQDPQAVPTALPYLGHTDRYLRFAARIALEHRPASVRTRFQRNQSPVTTDRATRSDPRDPSSSRACLRRSMPFLGTPEPRAAIGLPASLQLDLHSHGRPSDPEREAALRP